VIWDPVQYLRFGAERALPFRHLVAAVDHLEPATAVDIGCGPGGLNATLRPDLDRLNKDDQLEFTTASSHLLRTTYPERDDTTLFPFTRLFVVTTNEHS
jgi:trans-aconitate 2-methyltransferase